MLCHHDDARERSPGSGVLGARSPASLDSGQEPSYHHHQDIRQSLRRDQPERQQHGTSPTNLGDVTKRCARREGRDLGAT
eukprot:2434697-Rhodomonas_salina.1